MKKILIISHNNLNEDFWKEHLEGVDVQSINSNKCNINSLRYVQLNFDVVVIDTYFSDQFESEEQIVALGRKFISVKGSGHKYILSPIVPEVKLIDVKYSRLDQDFIDTIINHRDITISA